MGETDGVWEGVAVQVCETVGVLVALGGSGVRELVLERDLVDVVEGHTGVLERDLVDVVEGHTGVLVGVLVCELEDDGGGAMHSGAMRLVGGSHA